MVFIIEQAQDVQDSRLRQGKEVTRVIYLTAKEVAQRLAVAKTTVYLLCSESKIAHIRVGIGRGAIRISEEALEEFIKNATVPVGEANEAEEGPA
jgi:excisionase family DNA binding protein